MDVFIVPLLKTLKKFLCIGNSLRFYSPINVFNFEHYRSYYKVKYLFKVTNKDVRTKSWDVLPGSSFFTLNKYTILVIVLWDFYHKLESPHEKTKRI